MDAVDRQPECDETERLGLGDGPVDACASSESARLNSTDRPIVDNEAAAQREPRGTAKMIASMLAFFAAFEMQVVGILIAHSLGADLDMGASIVGAAAASALLVVLGGRRMLKPSVRIVKEAWSLCWWPITISAFTAVVGVAAVALGEAELEQGWQGRAVWLAVLCLAIGVFEEVAFRGVLLGGLLARLGRTRGGVFASAILSSLVFGAFHIDWATINVGEAVQVAQATLKIVQAGLIGFVFAVVAIQSRSVAGAALMHALDDYLLLFCSIALTGDSLSTEYVVVEAAAATESIISYVIACVLYLPPAAAAWLQLWRIKVPERGGLVSARPRPVNAGAHAAPRDLDRLPTDGR